MLLFNCSSFLGFHFFCGVLFGVYFGAISVFSIRWAILVCDWMFAQLIYAYLVFDRGRMALPVAFQYITCSDSEIKQYTSVQ